MWGECSAPAMSSSNEAALSVGLSHLLSWAASCAG